MRMHGTERVRALDPGPWALGHLDPGPLDPWTPGPWTTGSCLPEFIARHTCDWTVLGAMASNAVAP